MRNKRYTTNQQKLFKKETESHLNEGRKSYTYPYRDALIQMTLFYSQIILKPGKRGEDKVCEINETGKTEISVFTFSSSTYKVTSKCNAFFVSK